MSRGISLHIGLNHVDPNAYNGWDGQLAGCINDATAMQQIASNCGFEPTLLTDAQATAYQVVSQINSVADVLEEGDIFLLTYSGHGGQLPDEEGFEEDGLNETWVLYDRELIDNELYLLWKRFKAGVRIFVTSDSCHSGTVVKMLLRNQQLNGSAQQKGFDLTNINQIIKQNMKDYQRTFRSVTPASPKVPKLRFIPPDVSLNAYMKRREEYRMITQLAGPKEAGDIAASLIFISGCQDNQLSYDGDDNGLFTSKVLAVWNNKNFQGNYQRFYQDILAQMPAYQTPNYMKLGVINPDYENQLPFTIYLATTGSGSTGSSTTTDTDGYGNDPNPHVKGPDTWGRVDAQPPTFAVHKGANSYFYFEITADAKLFDYTTYSSQRNQQNFYATWDDPNVSNRLTGNSFTLPMEAWHNLKEADQLYYRIGTTSSQEIDQWNNFMLSTYDDEPANAPYIQLTAVTEDTDQDDDTGVSDHTENPVLAGSVGRGGRNQASDVKTVQTLLNEVAYDEGGAMPELIADGVIGSKTISAIERFQSTNNLMVDGLITPQGNTFSLLTSKSAEHAPLF